MNIELFISDTPSEVKPITDTFKLLVNFDDAPPMTIYKQSRSEIIPYIKLYSLYINNLKNNWGEWCNPTSEQIYELVADKDLDLPEHTQYDICDDWSYSTEYQDTRARVTNITVTWIDKHGVEFPVSINEN